MDGDITTDYVVAELFDMGFEFSAISKAIEAVGPSLNDAIDFMLNGSYKNDLGPDTTEEQACSSFNCSASQSFPSRRQIGSLQSVDLLEQTKPILHSASVHRSDYQKLESDWEKKVDIILKTYFGFTSLKGFQKEALEAWLANKDCLILAATGSGKSLCFQIPALLTGKVVVVISPLISLMHDQCLKLAQHGVSACFLGSGQTDSSVEQKAMSGMYSIIYVCPETILRLVGLLQRLAESRGIALFAIDEVHCVSKWGHDFRPDYRRLSVLRESFNACNLKSKCDIPLMALTATATFHVREDILKSLHMSKETKIVLTSFYRPNLRFSVCHSRTSCISSYEKDFRELIDTYTTSRKVDKKESSTNFHNLEDESESSSASANANISDADERSWSDSENFEDDCDEGSSAGICSENGSDVDASKENQMSVEYLEDELDIPQSVDDLDVSCGEFTGCSPMVLHGLSRSSETLDQVEKPDSKLEVLQGPLGQGPTIIYMPTRKETVRLAKYLCSSGVRAAAYHAKLPKKHLRNVHEKFHENILQVVVATIAFGMGIDKSNVRRIIHYGWPQSLEAYYQEAGRAGRDGKLADCTLYANLSRIPTLLPSKRSEEQTKQAYKMLSDCFRYGMSKSCCRAKILVKYFGEDLIYDKCLMCDICAGGPPELQNLKKEADIFLQVLGAYYGSANSGAFSYMDAICSGGRQPDLHMVMDRIREKYREFAARDQLWWRGLARILEDKGYIREGDDMVRVCIKHPRPTALGLKFLHSETETAFYAYPEADMLLPREKPSSKQSDWGRDWADPEIRRQRLQNKCRRKGKKLSRRSHHQSLSTVRGRIISKLSKQKR